MTTAENALREKNRTRLLSLLEHPTATVRWVSLPGEGGLQAGIVMPAGDLDVEATMRIVQQLLAVIEYYSGLRASFAMEDPLDVYVKPPEVENPQEEEKEKVEKAPSAKSAPESDAPVQPAKKDTAAVPDSPVYRVNRVFKVGLNDWCLRILQARPNEVVDADSIMAILAAIWKKGAPTSAPPRRASVLAALRIHVQNEALKSDQPLTWQYCGVAIALPPMGEPVATPVEKKELDSSDVLLTAEERAIKAAAEKAEAASVPPVAPEDLSQFALDAT